MDWRRHPRDDGADPAGVGDLLRRLHEEVGGRRLQGTRSLHTGFDTSSGQVPDGAVPSKTSRERFLSTDARLVDALGAHLHHLPAATVSPA